MQSVATNSGTVANRRRTVQREAREQRLFFQWAAWQAKSKMPELRWMYANLNGAYLQGDAQQRARRWVQLRAEGAKEGVADVFLPLARGEWHGLYLEFKAPKPYPSSVSAEQREFLNAMRERGYRAEVVYGWEAASTVVMEYYYSGAQDVSHESATA